MSKIIDKLMKTKWKDMGSILKVPKTGGTYVSSPQPTYKPGQMIHVPPGQDVRFADALGASLGGLARQQMEQQAAGVFNAFAHSHARGLSGLGGLAQQTYNHQTYANGISIANQGSMDASQISGTYASSTGYSQFTNSPPPPPSKADPEVDRAVDDVIARIKNRKEMDVKDQPQFSKHG